MSKHAAIEIPSSATASPVVSDRHGTPMPNVNNHQAATDSLLSSTTALFSGVGGQPKESYHNTGAGCCDDVGTFPSLTQLHQLQSQGNGVVRITLRDWYITNFCTDAEVQRMVAIQRFGQGNLRFWTRYFLCWSFFGDYLFYITVLPAFGWLGFERDGYVMSCMLAFGMWLTNTLKDIFAAPRPPSPPVRRGGLATHSLEYGLPSTHSCMAALLCFEMAQFFCKAYPHHNALVWLITAVSIFHICYSRVWLGMHWLGDIYAGLLCFVLLWVARMSFLRDFLLHSFDHWNKYPIFLPILFGHVLMVLHATPRGTCPCIEDSARFLGVLVGCTVGMWQRERGNWVDMVVLERWQLIPAVFSLAFLWRLITGTIVIAIVKVVTGVLFPPMLKHFFNVASGSLAPQLSRVPPLLWCYKVCCYAVGFLLGKQLRLESSSIKLVPFAKHATPLFSFGNNHSQPILVPLTSTGAINTSANGRGVHGHPIVSSSVNNIAVHEGTSAATTGGANGGAMDIVMQQNAAAQQGNVKCRTGSAVVPSVATVASAQRPNRGHVTCRSTSSGAGGAASDTSTSPGHQLMDAVVRSAEGVAFGSPTVLAPALSNPDANVVFGAPNIGNSISSAMGQVGRQINSTNPLRDAPYLTSPNTSSVFVGGADGGAAVSEAGADSDKSPRAGSLGGGASGYGGRYWSLRNHGHWWEHEMQSRYVNYMTVGWFVAFGAPYINNAIWGKYVHPTAY